MHSGQEQFLNFILLRVKDGKEAEARALLTESFNKQSDNTFNKEYMLTFIPRMISLLKPEYVSEVKAIMEQFGSKNAK